MEEPKVDEILDTSQVNEPGTALQTITDAYAGGQIGLDVLLAAIEKIYPGSSLRIRETRTEEEL